MRKGDKLFSVGVEAGGVDDVGVDGCGVVGGSGDDGGDKWWYPYFGSTRIQRADEIV